MMFIDSARIYIKSGDGGNGIVSFRREKYIAAGGPDGGDGGKGGDVIFAVDEGMLTLSDFRYKRHYKAQNGQNGGPSNRTGRSGEDLVIKVPPGTIIRDEETGLVLADLTKADQKVVIAKGGKGGKGNRHFATSTRQVPNFAQSGDPGEERWIIMELKLLADAGLIGFPNAGKSTILSVVSAANPKIANYPFTTVQPNLGVVSLNEGNSFVLADIPGLMEGAHEGVGLGHEFLKHIERTKVLIHVVDVAGVDGRDPLNDFDVINEELKKYSPSLAKKPQVVAANKIDLPDGQGKIEDFKKNIEARGYKVFAVSAATNKGIRELMYHVSGMIRSIPDIVLTDNRPEEAVYSVKEEEPFEIRKEGNIFIIEGNWVRNFVRSINFDNHESLQYFQRTIKRKGITDALEDMGINEGDTVRIYDFEFEYIR
jgi:GTP-binding protein